MERAILFTAALFVGVCAGGGLVFGCLQQVVSYQSRRVASLTTANILDQMRCSEEINLIKSKWKLDERLARLPKVKKKLRLANETNR